MPQQSSHLGLSTGPLIFPTPRVWGSSGYRPPTELMSHPVAKFISWIFLNSHLHPHPPHPPASRSRHLRRTALSPRLVPLTAQTAVNLASSPPRPSPLNVSHLPRDTILALQHGPRGSLGHVPSFISYLFLFTYGTLGLHSREYFTWTLP